VSKLDVSGAAARSLPTTSRDARAITAAAVSATGADALGAPPRPQADDEADIHAAVARGDRDAALTLLMRRFGDAVYRHISMMVRDPDLAADVHQQTFIEAFRDLDDFAGRSRFRTWLYAIARHRSLDALKSSRRRDQRFLADATAETDAPDLQPSAADRLDEHRLGSALDECLQQLAPAARMAVLLRYQEGLPFDEIARICRERAGTLQQRVARALPVLRQCVERRGQGAL